jgi:hypothetical protein
MATPVVAPSGALPTTTGGRGKNQIHWSEGVWKALDHAVTEEMMRTRVAAKFLPHVHVDKKQTTVASDIVNVPTVAGAPGVVVGRPAPPPFDPALNVDESATNRIQEYWVQFRMSVAQVEAEEHEEAAMGHHAPVHQMEPPQREGPGTAGHPHMTYTQRASTGVSLAMRTSNVLAQAEDLILFNGQNAVANSPLFTSGSVQALDPNLATNLDLGLLNITPRGDVILPNASQVIPVHPTTRGAGGAPPRYAEATLNAVAQAFSVLQGLGHYEHYALALHTVPYADLHQALPSTLIEPIEPISHLIKAGIHGTGTLPPFTAAGAGLPATIGGAAINFPPLGSPAGTPSANVLYTGVLVSLSGNTMDHVRGRMEDHLDVIVTFNQRDANEQYRFRVVERFCLRLKDLTSLCLMLFLDS